MRNAALALVLALVCRACPLPFLPGFCWNDRQARQERFALTTDRAYATLCDYPRLTLAPAHPSRSCLLLAASVLHTQTSSARPAFGFVFMVPREAEIELRYAAVLTSMHVRVVRFARFRLPSMDLHPPWLRAYQKLHVWTLDLARVLYIDADSVVLENIDWVFGLPDSVGCDCTGHINRDPNATVYLRSGGSTSAVMLVTPSTDVYHRLVAALWLPHKQYPGGDQDLIADVLRLPRLPATMQQALDVCTVLPQPLRNFPLHRAYLLHYAWFPMKGHELAQSSRIAELAGGELDRMECLEQASEVYRFFDRAYYLESASGPRKAESSKHGYD